MIKSFEQHHPTIDASVHVDESAVVIGKVKIGPRSSVWPQAVIRGDVNQIDIGNDTNIQDQCVLHVTHDGPYNPGGYRLMIGNQVTVGHRVVLHGCQIHDYCLIGIGAIIMDGVILHEETLIAAGTLVPPGKELTSGYLWKGSPAKQARPLTPEEKEFIRYSARYYASLAKKYS